MADILYINNSEQGIVYNLCKLFHFTFNQWSSGRVFALRPVGCGFDPCWVIPKTLKRESISSLLGTQYSVFLHQRKYFQLSDTIVLASPMTG